MHASQFNNRYGTLLCTKDNLIYLSYICKLVILKVTQKVSILTSIVCVGRTGVCELLTINFANICCRKGVILCNTFIFINSARTGKSYTGNK